MNTEAAFKRLYSHASPFTVLAIGLVVLAGADGHRKWLREQTLSRQEELDDLQDDLDRASQSVADTISLKQLKEKDLDQFKKGLSKLTESRRTIYEAGLLLQEEKRLLDKQWEMMTTYLLIDGDSQKINIMRGEQSLESYRLAVPAPVPFGGETKIPPSLVQITSKERFAHPERGVFEQKDGQLDWEPPQVGTSVRSNALGEFVVFTNSSLILHGPPKKKAEHEQFPHYCLQLDANTARKLYAGTFIGTKILTKSDTRLIKMKDNRLEPDRGE